MGIADSESPNDFRSTERYKLMKFDRLNIIKANGNITKVAFAILVTAGLASDRIITQKLVQTTLAVSNAESTRTAFKACFAMAGFNAGLGSDVLLRCIDSSSQHVFSSTTASLPALKNNRQEQDERIRNIALSWADWKLACTTGSGDIFCKEADLQHQAALVDADKYLASVRNSIASMKKWLAAVHMLLLASTILMIVFVALTMRRLCSYIQRLNGEVNRRRAIWNSASDALFLFEINSAVIVDVNSSGCEMLGAERSNIVGRRWQEFIDLEDLERSNAYLKRAQSGHKEVMRGYLRRRDGSRVAAEATISMGLIIEGKLCGLVSFRSLDAVKAAALELSLRSAIERALPGGIACIDSSGKQTYVNARLCSMVGWSADELAGQLPPFPYWPPEHVHKISALVDQIKAGLVSSAEIILMRRSGERFPAELIITELVGDSMQGWLAHVVDISERKQRQQEYDRAVHSEAVGHLSSQVYHDANNFMTVITLALDKLQRASDRSQELKALQSIRDASEQARLLLRGLLPSMLPPGDLNRQLVDLGDVLLSSRLLFEQVLSPVHHLLIREGPRNALVCCDRAHFVSAILNLLANARDSMAPGGEVTLEWGVSLPKVGDEPKDEEALVWVDVADRGIGMPGLVLERAFDPFFSTKHLGTGLGLPGVKRFAESNGGSIELTSEVGVGTRVRLTFPAAAIRLTESAGATDGRRPAHVMVLDDDADILEAAKDAIGSAGYKVSAFQSADDVISLIQKNTPDVLLVDVNLGGISGVELARAASEIDPQIHIIVSTGRYDLDIGELFDVLYKPYNRSELMSAIEKSLRSVN